MINFIVKAFIILIVLVNLSLFFRQINLYFPYFFGQETRQQFLIKVIAPDYWSVYDYNGLIKKTIGNSKALLAANAWHTYYIDFEAVHASLSGIDFSKIKSLKELADKIKSAGFDYLIIKKGSLDDLLVYTSIPDQNNIDSGVSNDYSGYFTKVYEDSYSLILIYKLK